MVPDSVAFWGTGALIAVFLFAASAPSPLYGTYAALWHFSASTLTVVFALYAFALLLGLLVTGRLSDHLGRRPVILGGIAVEIAGMVLFILANSTEVLGIARAVQGFATGAVIGVLSAALVELSGAVGPGLAPMVSSAAPTFGLATGALGSSALVQYGPAPLRLVYWLIFAALVLGFGFVLLVRETGERRPGALASLKPVANIHRDARPAFVQVSPSLVALWALIGFYLSLAPGLIASIEQSRNLLWGGAAIFCLCMAGSLAVVLLKGVSAWTAMFYGCAALFVGVGVTAVAIAVTDGPLFIIATVVAGVGFGLAFLGAFRAVGAVTPADERAGTLASLYIVSYLAFSVPIVLAGIAQTHYPAHTVALVFSGAVAVLAGIGAVTALPNLNR
ncbi:MFS transporter [Amycolatopsis sp. NPDC088138]|uniref:MFS transporter n=1 Tax=Amycolatopsis sp. NPDC088138 TaxID=3363938 RepID=UPI00382A684F